MKKKKTHRWQNSSGAHLFFLFFFFFLFEFVNQFQYPKITKFMKLMLVGIIVIFVCYAHFHANACGQTEQIKKKKRNLGK